MIVSIHQPAYLPWLGYFEKIIRSDIHIVLDHVQFEKNSFINRNKIGSKQGPIWLTVPVNTAGKFQDLPINEVTVCHQKKWTKKHYQSIISNYAKSPYFDSHIDFLKEFYETNHSNLFEINQKLLSYFTKTLEIETKIVLSSELNIGGSKSDLVLNLCKALNASTYLSGSLGRNYLDEEAFKREKINLIFQDYQHPVYQQPFDTFLPNLSIIDLLMQMGPQSKEVIMSTQLSSV